MALVATDVSAIGRSCADVVRMVDDVRVPALRDRWLAPSVRLRCGAMNIYAKVLAVRIEVLMHLWSVVVAYCVCLVERDVGVVTCWRVYCGGAHDVDVVV